VTDKHEDHKAPEMPAVDDLGSLGTGNAETGGAATGSVKRGGR
jgi:hypothetical protein